MGVTDELQELVTDHGDELAGVPWPWEADRWTELVFCLINAHRSALRDDPFTEDDAAASRAIADALAAVGVIEPDQLARASEEGSDARTVVRWVLGNHAYRPEDADSLVAILSHAASTVVSSFDGKIQRFLRSKAEQLCNELTDLIGTDQPVVRQGVAHWLQNVANLPLSVEIRPCAASAPTTTARLSSWNRQPTSSD